MSSLPEILGLVTVMIAGTVIVLWLVSLVMKVASIADTFWGFRLVIAAWTAFLVADAVGCTFNRTGIDSSV
ncbi:hypothetical protein HQ535_15290 [bacterium]|nr:hypothetical protein [bacterium]